MQTSFTPEQLRDPGLAAANEVLRTCVHCGFCTATCPTFVLKGDELDSPRGRIYLIKDMLEEGGPPGALVVRHIDRCLSCLSCMTTCPSGVHYMHLVDYARGVIETRHTRPWHDRLLRRLLAALLPYPARFRTALRAARLARPFAPLLPRSGVLASRMRAMLALAPERLPAADGGMAGKVWRPEGTRRFRVALLAGCAQRVLDPEINAATIRLLTRMGGEVVVPDGSGCCGALAHHLGRHGQTLAEVRANVAAWTREMAGEGLDGIVVNASGCGAMVKDYGFLMRLEPEADSAAKVAALAMDVSEALLRFGYAPSRPPAGITVAYHAACGLQHGQKITEEPKLLLAKAGFRVAMPAEAHLCCGSAGSYNMLQPEIADSLRERKLGNLRDCAADVVATGNIGCLTQLAGHGLPVLHTVMLLDWMAGGPRPAALEAAAVPEPEGEARAHELAAEAAGQLGG